MQETITKEQAEHYLPLAIKNKQSLENAILKQKKWLEELEGHLEDTNCEIKDLESILKN